VAARWRAFSPQAAAGFSRRGRIKQKESQMDNPIDKRNILDEEVFTYKITKDKKAFISYEGKQVTVLSGSKAEKFIADIIGTDGKEAQLIMAKITGNFKRGNEKLFKKGR